MPEAITADDFAGAGDAAKAKRKLVGKVADLIDRSGIDLDDIARVERINAWQGFYKTEDSDAEVVDLVSVQLVPTWADGPAWPVVQPAKPTVIRHQKRSTTKHAGRVTVLLPDPQIGYRRYEDGTLDPMHDERAIGCALELLSLIRPHRVVNLGDFLDLAEWSSKFAVHPEFEQVTQPALDAGHRFLADQQAAAGELEDHSLLEGNHDDRIARMVLANTKAALRLRQACEPPESWPVLSVPHLLRLDDLGVTYDSGYPAGRMKLADGHGRQAPLVALHGERTDMGKQARMERQSSVQGHAHHVSSHCETYELDGEAVEVEAWSLGCLCRDDGAVPSTKGGMTPHGRPVMRHESWQQAIAVVTETDDGWDVEPVRIRDGRAHWRGVTVNAPSAA